MMPWTSEGDDVAVEIPGYRVDIEREVDLIEEVVRVQGYDRVGSTLPPVRQPGGLPELYRFRHRVRDALMRAGLREVRPFPFASDADQELTGDTDAIRVTNPLQSDDRWLRTRLTPGLLKAIRRNAYRQRARHRRVRGEHRVPHGRRSGAGASEGCHRDDRNRRERMDRTA